MRYRSLFFGLLLVSYMTLAPPNAVRGRSAELSRAVHDLAPLNSHLWSHNTLGRAYGLYDS